MNKRTFTNSERSSLPTTEKDMHAPKEVVIKIAVELFGFNEVFSVENEKEEITATYYAMHNRVACALLAAGYSTFDLHGKPYKIANFAR